MVDEPRSLPPGRARVWKRRGRWWYEARSAYGSARSHTCNYHGHEDGEESLAKAADLARRQVAALDSLAGAANWPSPPYVRSTP